MLQSIKHNLSNLSDFSGRDTRTSFWFYVLFLAIVQMAISFAISLPVMGSLMGDAMEAARAGANDAEILQRTLASVDGLVRISVWVSVVLTAVLIAMLAASFTRRLHDSGRPGWIAMAAVLIQILALIMTVATLDDAIRMTVLSQTGNLEALEGMQGRFLVQGLLGWIPLILVVVFGSFPSTPGENRYGPQPLSA